MPFQIIRNDITKVKADAIVNTANPKPVYGQGTDSAIYNAAGAEELLAERKKIGDIARGDAKATPAFKLDAKYIIHTVGPQWVDGKSGELDVLRSCYAKSLSLANELGCKSIAFPLIAAGTYGFPKDEALSAAMSEISGFLMKNDSDMEITLVVYDPKSFRLSRNLFMEIASYIDDEDVKQAHIHDYHISLPENERFLYNRARRNSYLPEEETEEAASESSTEQEIKPFAPTSEFIFRDRFLDLIQKKGIEDNVSVYGGANVSKGAFSKIMCGDTKTPKKDAVMGFCISLKLDKKEADDLMASAGWAFNPYDKRDQLIAELIGAGKDIYDVNLALFAAHFDCLGKFD